jgi:FixJ family two-component response regulator
LFTRPSRQYQYALISRRAAPRRGHEETILIVDDDQPQMQLGEEMLAALGYEPICFDSSSAALAAFPPDPKRFDLVLPTR